MSKKTYEDGYRRGREGKSSGGTIIDEILWDNEEDKYSRSKGFEDGIRDHLREEYREKQSSSTYSDSGYIRNEEPMIGDFLTILLGLLGTLLCFGSAIVLFVSFFKPEYKLLGFGLGILALVVWYFVLAKGSTV